MATALYQAPIRLHRESFIARWFFPGMAMLMIATSIAGFAPAILNPASRRAPLSTLAAVHGLVFFAWLVLFLVQGLLISSRRFAWHRRVGLASVFVLALMVSLGYAATVTMVRRGFDLSGDQIPAHPAAGSLDPLGASIFNFGYLFTFTVLAVSAICFRRRPAIHKRLMFFANCVLMGAPIAHLTGHINMLTPAAIMIPFGLFLTAAVARDYLVEKRIHPLTASVAVALFLLQPRDANLIGPSHAWHRLAAWFAHK